MLNLFDLSRIKGFRFPRSVIGYAVWAYHRFALSLRDVEDLLASRGIRVSYETVRDWVARFGGQFAARIRRERPDPADKWHLDEVVISIKGKKHWLWRAVEPHTSRRRCERKKVVDLSLSIAVVDGDVDEPGAQVSE